MYLYILKLVLEDQITTMIDYSTATNGGALHHATAPHRGPAAHQRHRTCIPAPQLSPRPESKRWCSQDKHLLVLPSISSHLSKR